MHWLRSVERILARRDDGTQGISISQLGGVAAGAFLAQLWLPPSQKSAEDGAVSIAITLADNLAFSVAKEFLPDFRRAVAKNRKKTSEPSAGDARAGTR